MAVDDVEEARLSGGDNGEWTMRDEDARAYVRRAVDATVSLVESTFGPSGMEKLVVTEDPQNRDELVRVGDAGRIFEAIERGGGFAHPVAALFVDSVDGMQSGLRDGTTVSVLLAGAFLEEGFELVDQGLAPNTIVVGYGMARARAGEVLDALARPVGVDDEETLADVAATTMTTNLDAPVRRSLSRRVAATVTRLADAREDGWINTDDAKVLAQSGADGDVVDGLVLSRPADADPNGWGIESPIEDATLAILDREVDFEETASVLDGGNGVTLSSPDAADRYRSELEARVAAAADDLAAQDVDVLVCLEKLDESVVRPFEAAGVAVVDKATYPKEDVYRLARATDGTVVSRLSDLSEGHLGQIDLVTQRTVGDEVWTSFHGCPGPVYTVVSGGTTAAEVRRRSEAVEDALETTAIAAMDGQVLPGGGAPAAAVATALRDEATTVSGREQLAVESFADAVERVPAVLARNAGNDPVTAVTELRTAHTADGRSAAGIDLETGTPVDAWEAGVVEPRRVFSQAIETGAAVVEQLLTVDSVLYPNVQLPEYTPRPERE